MHICESVSLVCYSFPLDGFSVVSNVICFSTVVTVVVLLPFFLILFSFTAQRNDLHIRLHMRSCGVVRKPQAISWRCWNIC